MHCICVSVHVDVCTRVSVKTLPGHCTDSRLQLAAAKKQTDHSKISNGNPPVPPWQPPSVTIAAFQLACWYLVIELLERE